MKILALDTSTVVGSVALLEGERLIAEIVLQSRATHSARLLPSIDHLLEAVNWRLSDVEAISVTAGPGSFTGVRIGITTAKTLAYLHKIPLFTEVSLAVLALNAGKTDQLIVPMFDARKREIFTAAYRWRADRLETVKAPIAIAPVNWTDALAALDEPSITLLGNGLHPYQRIFEDRLGKLTRILPPPYWPPRASTCGWLTARRLAAGEAFDEVDGVIEYAQVNPLYCRKSEAELGWEERKGETFVAPDQSLHQGGGAPETGG